MSITRTTITIQTHQRIVVRHLREPVIARCERCVADVPAIAPEYFIGEMNLSPAALQAMLDQDVLHMVETPSGATVICCGHPPALRTKNATTITEENRDEDFD